MLLPLFLCFTLLPALEIYLLLQVGGRIGALNTFALLILMGFLGAAIAKSQGLQLLQQSQQQLARGEVPMGAPLHGLLIIIGGVLMVTPGFFTDVLGFLCVLPGTRHLIAIGLQKWFARQIRLGRIRFYGAGQNPFTQDPFTRPNNRGFEEEFTRDVSPQVIDVKPIRSTKTEDGNSDPTEG